jgi:hypothetical protein
MVINIMSRLFFLLQINMLPSGGTTFLMSISNIQGDGIYFELQ